MTDTAAKIIEFIDVSKNYGTAIALRSTTLTVKKGEFLTLLGPSGSGKSTLLNMLSGSAPVSSGRILLGGRDITNTPPRDRGIGMVFQNYALMPHMTAFENVAYPLKIRGHSREEIRKKVGDALGRVGLSGFEDRKPKQLSGGQQQRVGIARCIVYSPDIILMDEPLGALDKNIREQMQGEIKALHEDLGTTFIYVTHDQEEALNMSDRICLMNDGSIVQLGTPDDLYFSPANRFAAQFIGDSNLMDGAVDEQGDLRLQSGQSIKLPGGSNVRAGEQRTVMLRPERIFITPGAEVDAVATETSQTLSGVVESVSFVGSLMRLAVAVQPGLTLNVKATSQPTATRYRPGQSLNVRWNARDVVILGSDGKSQRIGSGE